MIVAALAAIVHGLALIALVGSVGLMVVWHRMEATP